MGSKDEHLTREFRQGGQDSSWNYWGKDILSAGWLSKVAPRSKRWRVIVTTSQGKHEKEANVEKAKPGSGGWQTPAVLF